MGKSTVNKKKVSFAMLLVTIGIVYGDIGTSPMYVMKSIIEGNGGLAQTSQELVIGSLSLVIWTITLLTTIKHVLIAMRANNHGEGGIFALYALVRGCGKWLIFPAMVGGAAMLADGVLTPAVTVTTAVEGLRTNPVMDSFLGAGQTRVIILTLAIILALFLVQRAGTSRIGKAFGPVMLVWFSFLGITGLVHIFDLPSVLKAFNPVYAVKVLYSPYNKVGFMILGSVFLAATGAEALYSDMGHVGADNIYITWPFVKICLILNYLGQGAWLICNQGDAELQSIEMLNPFFQMLPEVLRPLAVVLGAAAAVIASQALITGSFTLVSEAIRLDLLPHLEVKYPADTKGQLYIPGRQPRADRRLHNHRPAVPLRQPHGDGLRPCNNRVDADGDAAAGGVPLAHLFEEAACAGGAGRVRRDRGGVLRLQPQQVHPRRLRRGHHGADTVLHHARVAPRDEA